jgi:hypothetical protein
MKRLELRFSEEELTTIEDLSGNNYSPERVALYLDVDKKDCMRIWYQKESEVRQRYDRGQLVSEFLVNQKQHELAKAGNITAAQIFLKESEKNRIANLRNQILFGDDY